jgi:hypothetical protein
MLNSILYSLQVHFLYSPVWQKRRRFEMHESTGPLPGRGVAQVRLFSFQDLRKSAGTLRNSISAVEGVNSNSWMRSVSVVNGLAPKDAATGAI